MRALRTFLITTAIAAAALPGLAQSSATELLQKGIYAQQTAGALDGAIAIYRQIVNSAPAQREVAAQAQYLLAESLIRKGDFNLASQEFARLARDYSQYSTVVSRMVSQGPMLVVNTATAGPGGRSGPPMTPELAAELKKRRDELEVARAKISAIEFDESKRDTITGKVSQVVWMNPQSFLRIEGAAGSSWLFALGAPNALLQAGLTRTSIQAGQEVTVSGSPARDGSPTWRANEITSGGKMIFNRSALPAAVK